MKPQLKGLLALIPFTIASIGLVSCEVEKEEDGSMPSVDVEVEGEAKLPKYDVDAPDVDMGTKKVEVEVPTVDVIPASEDTNDE